MNAVGFSHSPECMLNPIPMHRCFSSCSNVSKQTIATQVRNTSRTTSRALVPNLQFNDDLFNYTRGRFVCDEKREISQRKVRFNVNELARCAAEATGTKFCTSIQKYPNSMYNKSMLLNMDDGSQVVAKVPNPNAGLPHFTTASEVATMDFARNVLGTPVPKVLTWSSRAHENSVGSEYIILEKVPGIELEQVWPNMNIKDNFLIVKTIAKLQKAWTSVAFKKFGSLYYAKNLQKPSPSHETLYVDATGTDITNEKFAIGPSTGRELTDNGIATCDFDRGPWTSLESYHRAIGHREIACINQLSDLPKSPVTLCGPGTYQPTRERKLQALQSYLKLINFILPADTAISSAHLWHDDLHVANIFVDPLKPTEIVGLIDWQSTELSPLYFHARQPHIIDYDGPPIFGLERPQLPENMNQLEGQARKDADTLYLHQSLCSLYNTLVHRQIPQTHKAFEFQQTTSHLLLLLARNLLIDGEASYLLQVAELEATWNDLPGAKNSVYPFAFSSTELEEIEQQVEGVARGIAAMNSTRENLGELFPEQGIVRPDQYDETMDALAQLKEQVIEEFAKTEQDKELWQKSWPFGT